MAWLGVEFLDNPVVSALTSLAITFGSLFIVYVEMPLKIVKKTGRKRSLSERLSVLSRTGKVCLFVFIISAIGSIASVIDVFNRLAL